MTYNCACCSGRAWSSDRAFFAGAELFQVRQTPATRGAFTICEPVFQLAPYLQGDKVVAIPVEILSTM